MSASYNPFIRGYENFTIERKAMIARDGVSCPIYRPVHASQSALTDADLIEHQCIYDNAGCYRFEKPVPQDVLKTCGATGTIVDVVYFINCAQRGISQHLGFAHSLKSAQDRIENLQFETGFYSRSWEISSAHITLQDFERLERRVYMDRPEGVLFETFRLNQSHAIGIKLIATPWTDQALEVVDTSVSELCCTLRETRLSQSFIEVVLLAAQADVRILIFDPDAPVLEGLAHYDW